MLSAAMRSGAVALRQKQRCRPALARARRLPPPDPGNYVRAHRTMPEEMRTLGSPSGSASALSFAKPEGFRCGAAMNSGSSGFDD